MVTIVSTVLVLYGTGEGQTAKVADRIAAALDGAGYDADVVDAKRVGKSFDIEPYDAVLVGSSIHLGDHQSAVETFARRHRDELAERPTGFFQVCLSAATDDPERQAEAARYVEEFVEETGCHPDRVGIFGGALRYSEYGFIKRAMMRKIAKEATGDTDASRDYEYTDWEEVEAFADDFATFVRDRLADEAETPPE